MKLDVPILSVDYSLAPEATFPRAVEEIFYAYCWALKNLKLLGSTGEKIVIAGDSAGGNLAAVCIIKCIETGIPTPSGFFGAYSTFLLNFVISPSRMMALMDSFLCYSILVKVAKCYGNGKPLNGTKLSISNAESSQNPKKNPNADIPKAPESEFIFEISKNHLLSPYWASNDILEKFPPTRIVTMQTDPCLDECVEFAKKLKSLKVDTKIKILDGLAHGFLNFTKVKKAIIFPIQSSSFSTSTIFQVSKESQDGSMVCMEQITELLKI